MVIIISNCTSPLSFRSRLVESFLNFQTLLIRTACVGLQIRQHLSLSCRLGYFGRFYVQSQGKLLQHHHQFWLTTPQTLVHFLRQIAELLRRLHPVGLLDHIYCRLRISPGNYQRKNIFVQARNR